MEKMRWVNERMTGWRGYWTVAVDWLTKGAHRQCLCDLKATTQYTFTHFQSPPFFLYMAQGPAAGCCLTGFGTHFMSWAALNSHIPACSTALCAHVHPAGHYDSSRVIIICPRHNAAGVNFKHVPLTRWVDHAEPNPHSGPLLELYCLWQVFGVKE